MQLNYRYLDVPLQAGFFSADEMSDVDIMYGLFCF